MLLTSGQVAVAESCLLKMKEKGFELETPAGISFAIMEKIRYDKSISNERWLAMLRYVKGK